MISFDFKFENQFGKPLNSGFKIHESEHSNNENV